MKEHVNIYCDESNHLVNDSSKVMVLGAVWCKASKKDEVFARIREYKIEHGMRSKGRGPSGERTTIEMKWNQVSNGKLDFYLDLIDYFFTTDDLHFRALIVPDKTALNHAAFSQNHDTFYYKMYFDMLKIILDPQVSHNIYLDIKDTKSNQKVLKLEEVLRNSHYDYSKQIIRKVQQVRSHEVELVQLADILSGAIAYVHRGMGTSIAKQKIVERIRHRSGYKLLRSTLVQEKKMNIFVWRPSLSPNQSV